MTRVHAASADGALLRARDVDLWYGAARDAGSRALCGVTLAVGRGDRVGLMGPAGSGKSTLLHVLAGLLRPQRGVVEWARATERVPSLVMQSPERQLFSATVQEEVAYGLRESGVAHDAMAARVAQALEDVGLPPEEFAARDPFHLSGGEMRRVGLASALAQRRPVLLLDEPTLGLDAEGAGRVGAILARVHARGVAYWLASHAADFIAATCDRVVVLDAGSVAFDGATADLWGDPARAAHLGVEIPGAAAFAARLRSLGAASLPAHPDDSTLAAALASWQPGQCP